MAMVIFMVINDVPNHQPENDGYYKKWWFQ